MTHYQSQYFCNFSEDIHTYIRLHETLFTSSNGFIELLTNKVIIDYCSIYHWKYSLHTTRRGYYSTSYVIYNIFTKKKCAVTCMWIYLGNHYYFWERFSDCNLHLIKKQDKLFQRNLWQHIYFTADSQMNLLLWTFTHIYRYPILTPETIYILKY